MREYSAKEAAERIGVSAAEIAKAAASGKLKKMRVQRGEPYRFTEEAIADYEEQLKRKSESVRKNGLEIKDGMLTTKESAEYLGIKIESLYSAVSRGRIMPDERSGSGTRDMAFKKETLDAYKKRTGLTREATSMAANLRRLSTADGYETARRLLSYAKSKGYENPWEAIKELLDEAGVK